MIIKNHTAPHARQEPATATPRFNQLWNRYENAEMKNQSKARICKDLVVVAHPAENNFPMGLSRAY
jgi:hypothetical protein